MTKNRINLQSFGGRFIPISRAAWKFTIDLLPKINKILFLVI